MFLKCRWCEAGVEFPINISKKRYGQVEALLDPISIAMKDEHFPSERVSNTMLLFLQNQIGRNLPECIARIMLENDQAAIIEGLLENSNLFTNSAHTYSSTRSNLQNQKHGFPFLSLKDSISWIKKDSGFAHGTLSSI